MIDAGRAWRQAMGAAVVAALVAVGCSSGGSSSPPTSTAGPAGTTGATTVGGASYQEGPCPDIATIAAVLATSTCGTLTVPEDRGRPAGRTIDLPVVVVPARSATPAPDPLVYMVGGPGGSALPLTGALVDLGLNAERDLIVMAQRGTSHTDPELTCPSFDQFRAASVGEPYDAPATGQQHVAAMQRCRDQFTATGADLGAYNTTENAADFEDLRQVLGIGSWNVYGVSYGTYLALSYLHLFPEGVRSVTVDSTLTPDATTLGSFWKNAAVGLGNIFTACEADPTCATAYPGVRQTFEDLVVRFEAQPIVATVASALPGSPPEPGAQPVLVNVDGGAFANWAAGLSEPMGPDLPRLITEVAAGSTDQVASSWAAMAATHAGVYSYGLQNGVICAEWVPYAQPGDPLAIGKEVFPRFPDSVLAHAPQFPFMVDDCRMWDVPEGDPEQRVLGGEAPVLFIAGSYDALTSPFYAEQAAAALPRATLVTIPGVGHFVLPKSPCAQQVMASFLADPVRPDTACVAGLTVPPFS